MLIVVAHGLVAVPGISPWRFGLQRSGKGSNGLFWRCAGVLACIALASLPAWSCLCHRCCAGVVAKLAFESLASAVLVFAGVALAFCLHCAGVIACIVLLLLLPA